MPRIEVFASRRPFRRPQWRFRVVAANGEILAQSEAYTERTDAYRGADALVVAVASARIGQAK